MPFLDKLLAASFTCYSPSFLKTYRLEQFYFWWQIRVLFRFSLRNKMLPIVALVLLVYSFTRVVSPLNYTSDYVSAHDDITDDGVIVAKQDV